MLAKFSASWICGGNGLLRAVTGLGQVASVATGLSRGRGVLGGHGALHVGLRRVYVGFSDGVKCGPALWPLSTRANVTTAHNHDPSTKLCPLQWSSCVTLRG